ncbi:MULTISPECIES: carboxymuconolactone decarboxylase family protein [Shewanella]|uniref:Carboxymuconolactone decarboxylase family protein n=1 Tax=Shewanella scandinavica TaxID=3063538 RepID=A0ABU3G2I2_9GAMM|nr:MULTISPECIES: carboxymuconolactone decarboxylase family protein [unclassified Shewanella]MDT3280782.1 carboxymuconolactone decarboxylase family protein [Shewanella sp. SP2S1-2]MDT3295700.1 carboxymuconolactone decarboxylase family protein [Shewanella sp. SP2S2-6]
MSERIPRQQIYQLQPALANALLSLDKAAGDSHFSPLLVHLVKLRASQLNSCAFCQRMHAKEARSDGEEQLRLDLLAAWHEVDGIFNERERAALLWTEILTQVATAPVHDSHYAALAEHYSEKEIVDLTSLIIAINGWNRVAIAFHLQPI